MAPIVLKSSSGSLALNVDEAGVGGWCQMHLVTNAGSRPLGAETLKYIAAALVSFLTRPATTPLRAVLGLSELHTVANGEHLEDGTNLYFNDDQGNTFARLFLTPDEKSHWVEELSPYTGHMPD